MSPRIPLDDPRVVALARARQQLAHEGMLHPTWDELTPGEQEGSLPDARSYLEAATRAGLVGLSRAEVLREAAGAISAMVPALQREYPDEPSNSPWACGIQDAAAELRRMADGSTT